MAAIKNALQNAPDGIKREDIFLSTKLPDSQHHAPEAWVDKMLEIFGTDYVDIISPQFPCSTSLPRDQPNPPPRVDIMEVWRKLEDVVKSGKARAIGISNFSQAETERILNEGSVVPAVHFMELHPYLQQKEFVQWNQDQGINVIAQRIFGSNGTKPWASTKEGEPIKSPSETPSKPENGLLLFQNPVITEIAEKHKIQPGQVVIAWNLSRGLSVSLVPPKNNTSRKRYLPDLLKSTDIELDQEDLDNLAGLDRKLRYQDNSLSLKYNLFADLDGKTPEATYKE